MLARDHYAALGLPPHATDEEIEQAYRHLSRRYHPDVNPGDPRAAAVFRRLRSAYEVLSDPALRDRYDRGLAADPPRDERGVPLGVQVVTEERDDVSWPELLARLTAHARRARPARGADIVLTVDVPLLHAERGRRVPVVVRRQVLCDTCAGRGRVRLQSTGTCDTCGGSGEEAFAKGAVAVTARCSDCAGDGLLAGEACVDCAASGLVPRDERALVRVPGGVTDGHELRFPGVGHAGPRGGVAGDLVARVRIVPVPGYERQGPHLHTVVGVPYAHAILGTRVEVPTLDGAPASLRVPPLTAHGAQFRLRGRGLEMSDGRRGDMLVRVQIRMPETIDEDGKRLVRQLAESSSVPRTAHPARAAESDR